MVTRSYLAATGYPQVGGDGLHISHMLWGGLLMLAGLLSQLLYIGRDTRMPAAVVCGVGFGLFIDEIGKFVTSDNNYFFQPTFGLIYVLLIALYLSVQSFLRRRPLQPYELVTNALSALQDAAMGNLTSAKRDQALDFLRRAGDAPLTDEVRALLQAAPLRNDAPPSGRARAATSLTRRLRRDGDDSQLPRSVAAMAVLVVVLLLVQFVLLAVLVGDAWQAGEGGRLGKASSDAIGLSFVAGIELATTLATAVLVAIGIRRRRRGELLPAYRAFERSLLLAILVTQVLAFFESWVVALGGLCLLLAWWVALRLIVQYEEERAVAEAAASAT